MVLQLETDPDIEPEFFEGVRAAADAFKFAIEEGWDLVVDPLPTSPFQQGSDLWEGWTAFAVSVQGQAKDTFKA